MRVNEDYLAGLPLPLEQWAEDIDRLASDLNSGNRLTEPAAALRHVPPPFAPPLDLWAEAVDRLLASG
jgi:hypothetical protein